MEYLLFFSAAFIVGYIVGQLLTAESNRNKQTIKYLDDLSEKYEILIKTDPNLHIRIAVNEMIEVALKRKAARKLNKLLFGKDSALQPYIKGMNEDQQVAFTNIVEVWRKLANVT